MPDPSDITTAPADTLYLIDGHAQIYRAYYAIRTRLTSPITGEPTQAIFGFAGMLLKLFNQFKPRYVAMAIDMPGKTFRDEIFPQYKAQRESPPDDFRAQEQRIFELTRLFGIPILGESGAEADDVIATACQQILDDPAQSHVQIRIVSRDKDLGQLLDDRVSMFDIHTDTTIDAASLEAEKGIRPDQVVDLLALTGDSVDNIPGITGIGPKTAAQLLDTFGSIEGIYDNIDKIKGKRKENLLAGKDRMAMNRTLVTLKRDVDMAFDLEAASVSAMNVTALHKLFTDLGFRRHVTDLEKLVKHLPANQVIETPRATTTTTADDGFATDLFGSPPEVGPTQASHTLQTPAPIQGMTRASDYDYELITSEKDLKKLVKTLADAELISIDTETTGLGSDAELCGISLAWREGHGVYLPVRSPSPESHLTQQQAMDILKPLLEDPTRPKTGHNLKFDYLVIRRCGVELRGIVFDTMIAAHLVGEPSRGLDALAASLLKHQMIPLSSLIGVAGQGPAKSVRDVPLAEIAPYAAEDADIALRLVAPLRAKLDEMGMTELAKRVEMPLVEVLGELQHYGIRLDGSVLDEQKAELQKKITALRDEIHELAGEPFNLDSPKQLAQILFTQLKLPVVKKTKTGPSTDVQVLEKLMELETPSDPSSAIPRLILEYRQFAKLVGTYLGNLVQSVDPATGRIHASLHQTGAATGRLSSSGPNLQNIPIRTDVGRQIRKAFVPEPGWKLISADYSQIELRMLAHLSDDENLIEAFLQDQDIHAAVAAQVFGVDLASVTPEQRGQAKTINFGIIYGVTAYGLARRIEGLDVDRAKQLIEDYRKRFSGIDRFLNQCVEQATREGYVTTIMGRRRRIGELQDNNGNTRALGERLAINTVVQGSATADLIKLAMVNLYQRIKHDQLPMRMLLQIHDELIFEAPADQAQAMAQVVREQMESAMTLKVPLKVEVGVGDDWYAVK